MPWLILIVLGGGLVLAHTAPFPFLLDWMHSDVAVWRMPRSGSPTVYLTFDDGPNIRQRRRCCWTCSVASACVRRSSSSIDT
jgi:hypothetical protein